MVHLTFPRGRPLYPMPMTSPNEILIALTVSNPTARAEARAVLEEAGHHVVEYATGAAAVSGNGKVPTLYLVDADLPDMSLNEVVQALHARDADLPVVVRVASDALASAAEALRAGAYDYVTHPGDTELLLHAIRRAAERRSLRTRVRELPPVDVAEEPPPTSVSRVVPLKDLERRAIEDALKATGGSVGKAAKLLGIGRATLYRRLAALELERQSVG